MWWILHVSLLFDMPSGSFTSTSKVKDKDIYLGSMNFYFHFFFKKIHYDDK